MSLSFFFRSLMSLLDSSSAGAMAHGTIPVQLALRARGRPNGAADVVGADVRISVVIPAMNEEENLPHVLPTAARFANEIVLVDGHSSDETVAVARALVPEITIVHP